MQQIRDEQSFQNRVARWTVECFGEQIAMDITERNHRFIEEALELVQANGCTQSEAHQLVDYVFSREIGHLQQEVGGVAVTLSALCNALGISIKDAAEDELSRVWRKIILIRAKQAAKPKHSPLPEIVPMPRPSLGDSIEDVESALISRCIGYNSGCDGDLGDVHQPHCPEFRGILHNAKIPDLGGRGEVSE